MSAETRYDEAMVRQALATLARSSHADGLPDRDADDMRRAAYVATQAMDRVVTRLRAAEARTAWQPIASVPIGETVMLWTPVRRVHVGHVTTLAWCEYTHWAPLPDAPEAP